MRLPENAQHRSPWSSEPCNPALKATGEPLLLWARPGAQPFPMREGTWSLALRDCLFPSGCLLGLTPAERPGRCQEYGCVSEVEGLELELGVLSDSGACALQVLESKDRGLRHFCQGCLWRWSGPQDEPGRPGCVGVGRAVHGPALGRGECPPGAMWGLRPIGRNLGVQRRQIGVLLGCMVTHSGRLHVVTRGVV